MSVDPELVVEQIDRSLRVLDDMDRFLAEQYPPGGGDDGPTRASRIVVAQILENAYTAVETVLLRVSQSFENSLEGDRWHGDLLDKMTLERKGIRPRVISDQTHRLLVELMRFRHFKRYYLDLDYDWEKLKYLVSVYRRCMPLVRQELLAFRSLLMESLRGA